MASDLHAYHIYRISEYYYRFVTETNAEYECSFYSYAEYFLQHEDIASKVFSFNITLVTPHIKRKGVDWRIADTVIQIVGDFLSSRVNAVVYVCDPTDGKGAARARKFKSWYNYYEYSTEILQLNTDIEAGGIRLYTAFLVHKKNKLRERFIQAYLDLVDAGEEK